MSSECAWSVQDWKTIRQTYQKIVQTRRAFGSSPIHPSCPEVELDFLRRWNVSLSETKAVAIDLWGTALVRNCLAPDDRFLFLKEFPPFNSLAYSREEIYTLRLQAESDARQSRRQQSGFAEVTLHEIYTRLGQEIGLSEEQITAGIEAEHSVERCLARPNLPVLQLIQPLRDQGKECLFVAETPHDSHFLHELLTRAGYAVKIDHLFTSAEHRLPFSTGALLRKAAKSLSLPVSQILALTSEPTLDATFARQSEFSILSHPYAPSPTVPSPRRTLVLQPIASLLHGTARQLPFTLPSVENPFWFQLGVRTLGPLLASFTLWLANEWNRQRIQHAYFLGRSGHLLLGLYQVLREHHPELPTAQHLHASRRAYLLPALGCTHAPEINALLHRQYPTPIGELLAAFELNPAHYTEAFDKAGFHSIDTPIDPEQNPIRLQRLFRQPEILSALNEQAQSERATLLGYLKQQQLITDRPAALVDLGGNTTTVRALLAVLQHEEIRHHLTRFHLLTLPGAETPQHPQYHYHSYLAHNGEPRSLSEPFTTGRPLFHALCSAYRPLVRYFAENDARILAICSPVTHTPEDQAKLHSLHQGILAYAQNLFSSPLHQLLLTNIPPEIAAENTLALLTHPTYEEASQLGALPDPDGGKNPPPLATLPYGKHETPSPEQLLSLYHRTAWKPGLLHGETELSWYLRQLVV